MLGCAHEKTDSLSTTVHSVRLRRMCRLVTMTSLGILTSDHSRNFPIGTGPRPAGAGLPPGERAGRFKPTAVFESLPGVHHYANRSNRSVTRGGSSQAVWRHGTGRFVPDRSAGRLGPRRPPLY